MRNIYLNFAMFGAMLGLLAFGPPAHAKARNVDNEAYLSNTAIQVAALAIMFQSQNTVMQTHFKRAGEFFRKRYLETQGLTEDQLSEHPVREQDAMRLSLVFALMSVRYPGLAEAKQEAALKAIKLTREEFMNQVIAEGFETDRRDNKRIAERSPNRSPAIDKPFVAEVERAAWGHRIP